MPNSNEKKRIKERKKKENERNHPEKDESFGLSRVPPIERETRRRIGREGGRRKVSWPIHYLDELVAGHAGGLRIREIHRRNPRRE